MAYLDITTVKGHKYYRLMKSKREHGHVKHPILKNWGPREPTEAEVAEMAASLGETYKAVSGTPRPARAKVSGTDEKAVSGTPKPKCSKPCEAFKALGDIPGWIGCDHCNGDPESRVISKEKWQCDCPYYDNVYCMNPDSSDCHWAVQVDTDKWLCLRTRTKVSGTDEKAVSGTSDISEIVLAIVPIEFREEMLRRARVEKIPVIEWAVRQAVIRLRNKLATEAKRRPASQ